MQFDSEESQKEAIKCGVQQGSVFSPIIYLLFCLPVILEKCLEYYLKCFFYFSGNEKIWATHNKFPVLLLESLVALSQLVGHQLVLVSLLLTGVQLFGQDEKRLLLTLQLALTHQELHHTRHEEHRKKNYKIAMNTCFNVKNYTGTSLI